MRIVIGILLLILTFPAQALTAHTYQSQEADFQIEFPAVYSIQELLAKEGVVHKLGAVQGVFFYELQYGLQKTELPEDMLQAYYNQLKEVYLSVAKLEKEADHQYLGTRAKDIKYVSVENGVPIYNYVRFLAKGHAWYTLKVYSNQAYPAVTDVSPYFDSFKFIAAK